jgi:hypothetical protein
MPRQDATMSNFMALHGIAKKALPQHRQNRNNTTPQKNTGCGALEQAAKLQRSRNGAAMSRSVLCQGLTETVTPQRPQTRQNKKVRFKKLFCQNSAQQRRKRPAKSSCNFVAHGAVTSACRKAAPNQPSNANRPR